MLSTIWPRRSRMADTLRVDVFPAIQRIAGRSTLTVFPSAPWSGSAAAHSAVFPSRILAASGPAGPNPTPRQADATLKTSTAKERERRTVRTVFNSRRFNESRGAQPFTVFPSAPGSGLAAVHSAVFPSRILAVSGPVGPNPTPLQADSTLKTNMAKERERRTVPTDFNSCDSTNRVALQQAKRAARRFSIAVRAVELFSLLMHSPAFIV